MNDVQSRPTSLKLSSTPTETGSRTAAPLTSHELQADLEDLQNREQTQRNQQGEIELARLRELARFD